MAEYIIRAPFSVDKMIYQKETGKVIYRSKMNPGKKRNFEIFDVLEFLALLSCHIPNKGEQMVRYYGFYSNVMRGKRKKLKGDRDEKVVVFEYEPLASSRQYRKKWSQLIKKVYEVNPLICPRCKCEMKIISFILDPLVVKKILRHLGLLEQKAHSPPADEAHP